MTKARHDICPIEASIQRARALLEAQDYPAALQILERAFAGARNDRRVRRLVALAALGVGDLSRSLVLLEALALERPRVESASVDLAVALLMSGRTDAARIVLERVTREGASPRAWACLGVAFERLGRGAAADVAFARAGCSDEPSRARARERATRLRDE